MSISTVDVKVSTIFVLNAIDYDPPMRVRYFEDVYGGKKGAKELAFKHCAIGEVIFRETRTSKAGKEFDVFGTCSRESFAGLVLKNMKIAELHPEHYQCQLSPINLSKHPALLRDSKSSRYERPPTATPEDRRKQRPPSPWWLLSIA